MVNMGRKMGQAKADALMSEIRSVHVECADCGRERWFGVGHLKRAQVPADTFFSAFATRLCCMICKAEGGDGRNVSVTPFFHDGREKLKVVSISSRATRAAG